MRLLNSVFGRQRSNSVSPTSRTTCQPKMRCSSTNEQADILAVVESIRDDMIDWLTSLPIIKEGVTFVYFQHHEISVYIGNYSDTMTFTCYDREYKLSLATQVTDQATREYEVHPLFHSNITYSHLNFSLADIASDSYMLKRMIEDYRNKIICLHQP